MDDSLREFLKSRGIPEHTIEKMCDEKIDVDVIPLMEESGTLIPYVPLIGDRMALVDFCRQKRSGKRRQGLIEKFKSKICTTQNQNLDNQEDPLSVPETCYPHTKSQRQLEIGWVSENNGKLTQVRSRQGGGTRKIKVDKSATKEQILSIAKDLFFPDGKSPKGKLTDFVCSILDFKHCELNDGFTIGELYNITKLSTLRLYLCTKKRTIPLSSTTTSSSLSESFCHDFMSHSAINPTYTTTEPIANQSSQEFLREVGATVEVELNEPPILNLDLEDGADQSSSSRVKQITGNNKECSYGESCYRKNPSHFQEFEHKHLNFILDHFKRTGSHNLPDNIKPRISLKTLEEQLEILKKLKLSSDSGGKSPQVPRLNHTENSVGNSNSSSERKRYSAAGNSRSDSPQAKRSTSSTPTGNLVNTSSTTTSGGNRKNTMSDPSNSTMSSEEHRKRMQGARNMGEAMAYMQEAKKRSQGKICDKHSAAAPYYFFLTSVTDSKKTHSEPLSILMHDVLDPSLGDLESSLQINFMVEFGWLVAQYHVAGQWGKPLTLLYGQMDVANLKFSNVMAVEIKCPSPFGSHHTKMCVLAYHDGGVRVCVHTANLVETDWDNRVQGVWLSPLCPALPLDADSTAGESPTNFKQDLIQYLSAYRRPELQPWLGKLRRANFSHINVFFVASTPGSHEGMDSDRWGLPKLAGLLRRHAHISPRRDAPPPAWQIIAQCSSIGSLGPQPTSWFCGEVKAAMSNGVGMGVQSPPPIRLVYPSFNNVAASHDGLLGGGCLPYSRRTHDKQEWLKQYLYQWKCDGRHRTQAMPHIKTYTRVSPDLSELAWFHLTSANLSKAAWGTQTKAGATTILSYEAGVLMLPKFVTGTLSFPIKPEAADYAPVFPMPYDLPLTPYSSSDTPWFMDNLA